MVVSKGDYQTLLSTATPSDASQRLPARYLDACHSRRRRTAISYLNTRCRRSSPRRSGSFGTRPALQGPGVRCDCLTILAASSGLHRSASKSGNPQSGSLNDGRGWLTPDATANQMRVVIGP